MIFMRELVLLTLLTYDPTALFPPTQGPDGHGFSGDASYPAGALPDMSEGQPIGQTWLWEPSLWGNDPFGGQ